MKTNGFFRDKVVLITGGTKGIGRSCTTLFAEHGAKVIFTGRNSDDGRELQNFLVQMKKQTEVRFVNCDVSDADEIKNLFLYIENKFGELHVLINNAATHISKLAEDYTVEDFEVLIRTNVRNYFLHTKYALPYLKKSRGSIVNISSSTGKVGQFAGSLYSATKGAINSFTKSVAIDYARVPVRVNAILPAYVDTPLLQTWLHQQSNPEEVKRSLGNSHVLGRISHPDEIASLAVFLASDGASTITGAVIDADGGATLEYSPALIPYGNIN